MLNRILYNLINHPEDECYQIKDAVYKNKDLYRYVCSIYSFLTRRFSHQDRIVVYGHKEIYMLASFLACSFAGMTYIPVDVSIPVERRNRIIEQAQPKFIIDKSIEKIIDGDGHESIPDVLMRPEDVYYIIFTSGSTGEPKGIQITYANLMSCMSWLTEICGVNNDTILNQANYSFDLSVADLYLPLLTRSKHYIIERSVQRDFPSLFKELKNSNAGLAVMTPSFADLLMVDRSFNKELMPRLKKILFCGERLTEKTAAKLFDRFDGLQIINSYGPTECTFAVTSTTVMPNEEISIGIPKSDVDIFIVDKNLEILPDGKTGEILIAGESVGKGYLKKELNDGTFITFNGRRAYLTGDLGCKKDDLFYCVGRNDKQVKFKGYRIELSEIENVINAVGYVEKSLVTAVKNDENTVIRIVAFVKLSDARYTARDIKNHIKQKLPDYMIPTIRTVSDIPLTENGKVNEKALLRKEYERQNS